LRVSEAAFEFGAQFSTAIPIGSALQREPVFVHVDHRLIPS
jgi:hypothetical protein